MKLSKLAMALVLGLASATAFACPKGTHLVGGTGPHHKGGKCVDASASTSEAKPAKSEAASNTDAKATKKQKGKKKKGDSSK